MMLDKTVKKQKPDTSSFILTIHNQTQNHFKRKSPLKKSDQSSSSVFLFQNLKQGDSVPTKNAKKQKNIIPWRKYQVCCAQGKPPGPAGKLQCATHDGCAVWF